MILLFWDFIMSFILSAFHVFLWPNKLFNFAILPNLCKFNMEALNDCFILSEMARVDCPTYNNNNILK